MPALCFKGAITHKSPGQDVNLTCGNEIDRVLLIGSDIYTLSDALFESQRPSIPSPKKASLPLQTPAP